MYADINENNILRRDKITFIENNFEFIDDQALIDIKKIITVSLICDESEPDKMKRITLEIFNK